MNMLPTNLLSLGNQLLTPVNNPFFGVITTGPLAQSQVKYGQLLLPFPEWQTLAAASIAIGNSEFHAMQASFTTRYSKGVIVIGPHTWSKLMTDVSNTTWAVTASVPRY